MTTLLAKLRDSKESLENIRNNNMIPAISYSHGKDSISISIPLGDFIKVHKESGETSIVTLEIEGGETLKVLIGEIQKDPVKSTPIHVDFLIVNIDEEKTIDIPLKFVGESQAVKGGGVLIKNLYEIEVTAKVKDLPNSIEVDLSLLENNEDVIKVKDIKLPAGVITEEDPTRFVASTATAVEEDLEEIVEVDMDSIKVTEKGKKEAPETEA